MILPSKSTVIGARSSRLYEIFGLDWPDRVGPKCIASEFPEVL